MIEAQDVSYHAGGCKILDHVHAAVELGKVTAILGPNGAGKSTLLKCLTASHQPDGGRILLEGKLLSEFSLNALSRKRAVLSQSNPISFPFTVFEIVMMGRNPYMADKNSVEDADVVRETLESVDGWHLKDRIFPTLSGGEQQRVQLARVLAQLWEQEKAYLFLDEPTMALDLKHQHQIFDLACKMASEKAMAVCVILHDLNLAMRYADCCILIQAGKIFASGITNEVLTAENIRCVFEVPAELVFASEKTGKAA